MNYPIDITNVTLKTKRLVLRPFKLTDLDDLFEYASVNGVGQMAGWLPHKTKADSLFILNMFIDSKNQFALVYNNKVIGSLGIEKYNEAQFEELHDYKVREIGYVLSKDYWGNGLMPEAVKAVIDYLFNEVKLDALLCGYFTYNKRSQAVSKKCGFTFYKNILCTYPIGNDIECVMTILKNTR